MPLAGAPYDSSTLQTRIRDRSSPTECSHPAVNPEHKIATEMTDATRNPGTGRAIISGCLDRCRAPRSARWWPCDSGCAHAQEFNFQLWCWIPEYPGLNRRATCEPAHHSRLNGPRSPADQPGSGRSRTPWNYPADSTLTSRRFFASRPHTTPIRWTGSPRPRYLSA